LNVILPRTGSVAQSGKSILSTFPLTGTFIRPGVGVDASVGVSISPVVFVRPGVSVDAGVGAGVSPMVFVMMGTIPINATITVAIAPMIAAVTWDRSPGLSFFFARDNSSART
jgi:hypothetical protein